MESSSLVSVVLPTYNGVRYLGESLDSCLGQSYTNIEVVVVVDGSTDSTMELLEGYTDPRLTVLRNHTNLGLPRSLNRGFAHSTGSFLTWTSDDNRYVSSAIGSMVAYLDSHAEADLVYASYWEIDPEGRHLDTVIAPEPSALMDYDVVGACFLYRRCVYDALGGYSPEHAMYEDYEYWLRASRRFAFGVMAEPLYEYRLHPASLSSRRGLRHARDRRVLQLKLANYGLPPGTYSRKMAALDMDEAYEAFVLYADRRRSWHRYLRSVSRFPAGLANLGMLRLMATSLLPGWRRRQSALQNEWSIRHPSKARWLLGIDGA